MELRFELYWDDEYMPSEQIYLWLKNFFRSLAVDEVSPLVKGDVELREV